MNRRELLDRLAATAGEPWDVLVIGGGASGLGAALDAASRGCRTVLLEQHDFAKGTSSRSTKLIHGGVRYLRQGNLSLVIEALHERGLLMANAPSLVKPQRFVIPNYSRVDRAFYGIGLRAYDALAGKRSIGRSGHLTLAETLAAVPTIQRDKLRGGTFYYDAQFDDARLAIALVKTLVAQGGVPANYMQVQSLIKSQGRVRGVEALDVETQKVYAVKARVVVNATGVFSDSIRRMDQPSAHQAISPSQGIHLVVDREFLPSDSALMIPKTSDGRVLFAIPWINRVLIGTTDTAVRDIQLEPRPLAAEVDYLLEHAKKFLDPAPQRGDVRSAFAGLRPLVKPPRDEVKTASVSREHQILVSESGLVSVLGGKWTTFRKMGADVIDHAMKVAELSPRPTRTATLRLDNASEQPASQPMSSSSRLHEGLPYWDRDVVRAVRDEMARTLEDVLARRTRSLFLDARYSLDISRDVANIMARELHHNDEWAAAQIAEFTALAKQYLISA